MDIFSFTYIIFSFQTLELITALHAGVTSIASTVNSTCNRVPELRPISTRIIVPIFMIPPRPFPNQNSHFIISPAMARARRTNNRIIVRSKRRHFVIELKLKRKEKRKTSLYIYKFLSKKFLNYSSNFFFAKKNLFEFSNYLSNFSFAKKIYLNYSFNLYFMKKIYLNFSNSIELFIQFYFKKKISNYYFRKNVQLLIRILFREKFINYIFEKNLSEFSN